MKLNRAKLRKIILNEIFGYGSDNPSVDIVFDDSNSDRYDTYIKKSKDGNKYILIATEESPPAIRIFKGGDEIEDSVKFNKNVIPAQGTKAALKLLKDKKIDLKGVKKVYVHQV